MKMAVLRYRDVEKLDKDEQEKKLKELKIELVKKTTPTGRSGKVKNKEIKKAIARILTLQGKNKQNHTH